MTFDNRISQYQELGKGELFRPARLEKRTSAAVTIGRYLRHG
jgi:hypothetical protein